MANAEHVVQVNLAGSPYDIHIGTGVLGTIGERLKEFKSAGTVAIVTDSNVARECGDSVRASLQKAGQSIIAEYHVPAGEENKSLDQIARAYDVFLRAKI